MIIRISIKRWKLNRPKTMTYRAKMIIMKRINKGIRNRFRLGIRLSTNNILKKMVKKIIKKKI